MIRSVCVSRLNPSTANTIQWHPTHSRTLSLKTHVPTRNTYL